LHHTLATTRGALRLANAAGTLVRLGLQKRPLRDHLAQENKVPTAGLAPALAAFSTPCLSFWATWAWSQRQGFHPHPPIYKIGALVCHAGIHINGCAMPVPPFRPFRPFRPFPFLSHRTNGVGRRDSHPLRILHRDECSLITPRPKSKCLVPPAGNAPALAV
jgi:hypothetical protein